MKNLVCMTVIAVACSACAVAPAMISSAVSKMDMNDVQNLVGKVQKASEGQRDLTQDEEIALGESVASNLLGAAPLLQDKKVQRYVNQVGLWLAAQTERADLPWHFAVLDDNEFNAFATPGGYVFITRGMLLSLRNEAELAGVLAHEIAHVVRKHHLVAMKKANLKSSFGDALSSVMASAPVAASKVGQVTQANPAIVKLGATMVSDLYTRGLDKDDEYEADRMGVVIAARAGYDPYGLPAVLQSLQTVNPNYAGLALLFKTHPSFASRLDLLAKLMDEPFASYENQPNGAARFKSQVAMPKLAGK